MADNVSITEGTGREIATDNIGGVDYPRVKLSLGADGSATDVPLGTQTADVCIPVTLASDSYFLHTATQAYAGTDTGIPAMTVCETTPTALAADVGMYAPLETDLSGQLFVTNYAIEKEEDAEHSSGDKGVMALAVRKDTAAALADTTGDYAPLEVDAPGRLYTNSNLAANSGVDIGDVDVTSMPTGANASQVQGTVAHDSAAAQNPVQIGATAQNAEVAAVATGDVARLVTDLVGKLIVLPYANPENFVKGATAVITDTTRTAVIAAQGAGVKLYITQILVTNSDATVGTVVNIEDDTTTIYSGYAAAAGGGFSCTFPVPLVITANKALNASCVTTSSETRVSASGYKGA
jgi:hypothetical protein